ncbi:MAG: ABC transporter ATP-binding protein [Deltaproteobacteria bacterium]|nr:ABC transporter ATP-binding protein [Deltaproteobacteria bacterium]
MIKLVNLTKLYKGLRAVDDLNISVREGIIFGFLGPNGAGKTTTIRMMAGILRPTRGKIFIDGMDLEKEPSKVKGCSGFIPDRPFLYEKLTGMEFLRFLTGLYGLNNSLSTNARLIGLLEIFELVHWKDELIEGYSHGMKQRLVMCGALVHDPKVLIVDEPMVGLDPKGARLVKNIFREQAAKGRTIFMSTHSLETAQEVCHEIAIIKAGKVIAQGTVDELRQDAGVEGNLENAFLKLTGEKGTGHERPLSSS